jgi:hypothetical protein
MSPIEFIKMAYCERGADQRQNTNKGNSISNDYIPNKQNNHMKNKIQYCQKNLNSNFKIVERGKIIYYRSRSWFY